MKRNTGSTLLIVFGIFFLMAALLLTGYNFWSDRNAQQASAVAVKELSALIPTPTIGIPMDTLEDHAEVSPEIEEVLPYYVINPSIEMLEQTIGGTAYVGILEIPTLELELPIASQWNNRTAQKAPCRYTGTPYLNNMVIAGHNYQTHFGKLSTLPTGTQLFFTDMEGNRFSYQIIEFETVQPTAIEEMCTGDWDLTLFTCTIGGRARIAVRCEKTEPIF